jgi:DNA primase
MAMDKEKLREQFDLVRWVSRYVPLRKEGARWIGACPFPERHVGGDDSTPSFNVYPKGYKGQPYDTFYCHGCGAGNDIYAFLMLKENLSFQDALGRVAQELGFNIAKSENEWHDHVRVFQKELLKRPEHLRYLTEQRGLTMETIRRFELGVCPEGYEINGKRKEGCDNRIAIPLRLESGSLIGFSFRALDGRSPKYIRTSMPQPMKFLYGSNLAKKEAARRGETLLVEGFFDVMALHQHGAANAVAMMTNTCHEPSLLTSLAPKVLVWLDGDKHLQRALLQIVPTLESVGLRVNAVAPPPGLDPDEVALEQKKNLLTYIESRRWEPWHFLVKERLAQTKSVIDGIRRDTAHDLINLVNRSQDPLIRQLCLEEIASTLNVPKELLQRYLNE